MKPPQTRKQNSPEPFHLFNERFRVKSSCLSLRSHHFDQVLDDQQSLWGDFIERVLNACNHWGQQHLQGSQHKLVFTFSLLLKNLVIQLFKDAESLWEAVYRFQDKALKEVFETCMCGWKAWGGWERSRTLKKESASILMVDRVDLSVREKMMPAGRRGEEQKEKR